MSLLLWAMANQTKENIELRLLVHERLCLVPLHLPGIVRVSLEVACLENLPIDINQVCEIVGEHSRRQIRVAIRKHELQSEFLQAMKRRHKDYDVPHRRLLHAVVTSFDVQQHWSERREVERHVIGQRPTGRNRNNSMCSFADEIGIADFDEVWVAHVAFPAMQTIREHPRHISYVRNAEDEGLLWRQFFHRASSA